MSKDTDKARIVELQAKVTAIGARVPTDPVSSPGYQNALVDRALGMLAANDEIRGVKGTP